MIDAFRERARAVASLLGDPRTTFVVVTTPEREPSRQAVELARELESKRMRRGAIVFNRVDRLGLRGHATADVRDALAPLAGARLAARAAANLADFDVLATRDRDTIAEVTAQLGAERVRCVPHFNEDVRELATLARVGADLLEP